MTMQKRVTVYLRGKLFWAKIFGNPRPNYDGDAREWTFEFEPDDASVELFDEHEISDKLRDRRDKKGYEDRGKYVILKRGEFKHDGSPNEHIRVVDADNAPWQPNTLIGNETTADVKVTIVDYGPRKKKGIYPVAIRVLDLVPFQQNEFAALPDEDPRRQAAKAKRVVAEDTFKKDFGMEEGPEPALEDDLPFEPERKRKPTAKRIPDEDLDDDVPM